MNIRHAYFIIILLCANNAHGLSIGERKMLGSKAPPPIASARQRYEEMQKQSSREQAEQALIEKNTPPALTKEDIEKIMDEKMGKAQKEEAKQTEAGPDTTPADPTESIENNPNFGAIGGLGTVGGIGAAGELVAPSP